MADVSEPLIWRIPPWQPALLFLVTSACAALNLYSHPSATVRFATIIIGLAAFCTGVAATRMYFVADADGIAVRRLLRDRLVSWDDVRAIDVVTLKHGNSTIRLTLSDSSQVDVPPSLLQPTMPTRNQRALAQVGNAARAVESRAEQYRLR